jgi:hypothetical protein
LNRVTTGPFRFRNSDLSHGRNTDQTRMTSVLLFQYLIGVSSVA